jgi:probable F420-dependent oxidoreductase
MTIKIGFQPVPQHGTYERLRQQWMKAEEMGADGLYSADHFFAQVPSVEAAEGAAPATFNGLNFEGTTIQAAMAATTTRAEIGCIVHANSYRNPNLMADIARTIDHISGGRYVLGIGSGYQLQDYVEYGYEYGTTKSRLEDLARNLPIIKARFEKLNPKPIRKIPILIASMGEQIGMRIVAEHADRWHVYGPLEKIIQKTEVLKEHCKAIGRDFSEIELTTWYFPNILQREINPDEFLKLGIRNIIQLQYGPEWDLGLLRELIEWRDQKVHQGA